MKCMVKMFQNLYNLWRCGMNQKPVIFIQKKKFRKIKHTGHHKLACCGKLGANQSVYQVKREITTELIKYLGQDKIGFHKCLLYFYNHYLMVSN
jgi:hypothetical protein